VTTTVKNTQGKFLNNKIHINQIISAVNKDETTVWIDDRQIDIVQNLKLEDNWVIIVDINLEDK